jgi:histidine ammonia-lyase
MIVLGKKPLTLANCLAISAGTKVCIAPEALVRVTKGAQAVAAIVAKGDAAYGINTGFGKLAKERIGDADLAQLQLNLVRSHRAGIGEPLPEPIVRLVVALKIASLLHGFSGVRADIPQLMADTLNAGVLPYIPAQGSVGASGDLAPLAELASLLIGEGRATFKGKVITALDALTKAKLFPVTLGPKEGLAILNGTQVSTAIALTGLFATHRAFNAALIAGAMSVDAAAGSDSPFDARIHTLRGHKSQIDVAAALRNMMQGSAIRTSHLLGDDRVQDPYSLRCQPQVMGACLELLRFGQPVGFS